MKYYAIQVITGSEEKFIKLYNSTHSDLPLPIYHLQRELKERHDGKTVQKTLSLFPGYLFIACDDAPKLGESATGGGVEQYHWALRRTDGFIRFLRSNQDIVSLEGRDLEIVLHFILKTGSVAGISKVFFNESERIVVSEGPLKGLEGKIIKVDKRKGRAKIKLDLYGDAYVVDLGFEIISAP
jgi:transcriptional antiterminator NusG